MLYSDTNIINKNMQGGTRLDVFATPFLSRVRKKPCRPCKKERQGERSALAPPGPSHTGKEGACGPPRLITLGVTLERKTKDER